VARKFSKQDPYADREASNYQNPIPSREFITQYLEELGRPASKEHLIKAFKLKGEDEKEAMRRRLLAMMRDGQLMCNRRGSYGLVDKMDLIRGRVIGHPDGFGFVVPDTGGKDLFLSDRQMRLAFHGDRVLVRERGLDRRGRREAVIIEVLERNTDRIVGRLISEGGVLFVVPDNKHITQDILIPPHELHGASNGQIVLVELMTPPTMRTQAIGRIVEVLGEHMAPGMEIAIALRAHNLPHTWPEDVLQETKSLHNEVSEQDKQGRTDLRDLPFVTIDGEDARDFDDAVFCKPMAKGGWQLYVAIADVSHYVQPGTALDREASNRGNSVYFPSQVIPMLPEILSNGLCSLNPKVDRLCMVCEMSISPKGKLTRYYFYKAVMHSKARLTYTKVASLIARDNPNLQQQYTEILPHIDQLYALYQVLLATREERGALDFATIETKIEFGKNRKIKRIVPMVRNEAHRLIEECMLAANVATARFLEAQKIPALYRVHEPPKEEKAADLRQFLAELGLELKGHKQPKPKDFAAVLSQVAKRDEAHLIRMVMLRSLKQAIYTPKNDGHFGLAYPAYTHFTSPIRRYPDLLIHRAIAFLIEKKPLHEFNYSQNHMEKMGDHCSMTERRADDATRDVVSWLKCEYMQDKVGKVFDGIISAVTSFGVFVELREVFVEGLVHITDLHNDYYHFDALRHQLLGKRSGRSYRVGQPLRVTVARVDLDERKIDFILAEENA
jgi:ribonuclease R